jgi:DNA mismatch endonuclease (patch repair protein)
MTDKKYIRDKRSPIPKSEAVSRMMSANKGSDTNPERTLRKALRSKGLIGYRLNYKKVPGKPDICFVSKKVAIFVNGCFWHRCPHCNYPNPKHNQTYWIQKFNKTTARDKRTQEQLKELGWRTFVIWECEIKKDADKIAENLASEILST